MGDQRRLNDLRAVLVLALLAAGCGREQASVEEQRRELLRPPDLEKLATERREEARILSEDGELLESDEVVAGVRLPRGFTLRLALEHEWYYRSRHVRFEALDRYFQTRLTTTRIERSEHTVRYDAAKPRGQESASGVPFVTVRIGAAPGESGVQEIYIRRPPPGLGGPPPSEAHVRAELEAAQRTAE